MKKANRCIMSLILLMAMIATAPPARAMTGNDWRQYEEVIQRAYLAGIFDSWAHTVHLAEEVPILKDPVTQEEPETELYHRHRVKDMYGNVTKCVTSKNITYEQLTAIANRYLNDHPESWHYSMASLFWSSLYNVCKK
ncbi:MAG TPA: hypothetical protein PKN47_08315 [Nitrospira sp.]|nr:hypothetical protein [Nitrospira sp.]